MSSAGLSTVEELRRWLAKSLSEAFREGLAIEEPAGCSDTWRAACQQLGVTLLDESERADVRVAQQPSRGAPIAEMAGVVEALAAQARKSLESMVGDGDGGPAAEHSKLRLLIDRTSREATDAYRRAVLPPPPGMFDRALDHAAASGGAGGGSHVLTCDTCGAPQIRTGEFVCPFCDHHMAGA